MNESDDRNPVEQLAEEFAERHRQGERPSIEDYARRYPQWADEIRDLFPALVMMERLGADDAGMAGSFGGMVIAGDLKIERLGDYRILREVGRGGMGVVYEAEQESLGRHVALKVLPAHSLLDARHLGRFHREARAAARLHHTNIVPVYGVGEHNNLHYYVMQFIHGRGLDEVLGELRRIRRGATVDRAGRAAGDAGYDLSAEAAAHALLSGTFRRDGSLAGSDRSDHGAAIQAEAAPAESQSDPDRHSGTAPDRCDASATKPAAASDLSTMSESGRLYWHSVARIGAQVADALAYAHGQGTLHRDIKPSNLLLDTQGTAWITDFGLAKVVEDQDDLTHTGDIVGTLRFMAPERFRGEADARSDIYGLGLTLYELLTLTPAFQARDRERLVHQILHDDVPRPRRVNPSIPRDLETIVLKATAREPALRYDSAWDLADDLRRFLEDKPIRARRLGMPERFARWCRRSPLVAALSAALILVFVGGFAGVTWNWREAVLEREAKELERLRAEQAKAAAESAREHTETALYRSHIARAQLEWRANSIVLAEQILERCPVKRRGWEWRFLKQLNHAELFTMVGHTGWVNDLTYTPDGRFIVSAGGGNPFHGTQGPSTVRPGEIIVSDAATGETVRMLHGHSNTVGSVSVSPDGQRIVSTGLDRSLRLWELASGAPVTFAQPADPVHDVAAFSPAGNLLAVATETGSILFFDTMTGSPLRKLQAHASAVIRLAFSRDGSLLATTTHAYFGGEAKVWRVHEGTEAVRLEQSRPVNDLAFSPDGRTLAAAADDGIVLWELKEGRTIRSLVGHRGAVAGVAFSPDGAHLASAGSDTTVRVWDVVSGQEVRAYHGHAKVAQRVAFSPNGERLASGGRDGTVKVWDLSMHPERSSVLVANYDQENDLEAVGFLRNGAELVLVGLHSQLMTRNSDSFALLSHKEIDITREWMTPAESAHLDSTGEWLAAVSREDRRIAKCWSTLTGQVHSVFSGHRVPIRHVTASRGAERVATGGHAATSEGEIAEIKVWDRSGSVVTEMTEQGVLLFRLALSPDGRRLAISHSPTPVRASAPFGASLVRVIDLASRREIARFQQETDAVLGLSFDDSGTRLAAAGGFRGTVHIWDLRTGRVTSSNQGPEMAMDCSFSPDGTRLIVAGRPMVKLIDVDTADELLVLRGDAQMVAHDGGFNPRARFSPDGTKVAALCGGSVSVWGIEDAATSQFSGRLRNAERRAITYHLQQARRWANRDPATSRFHLQQLAGKPLESAPQHLQRAECSAMFGRWTEAEADLSRAAELSDRDPYVMFERARILAGNDRWLEAAADFQTAFESGLEFGSIICRRRAFLQFAAGDYRGYRSTCRDMINRFGESPDLSTAVQLARAHMLESKLDSSWSFEQYLRRHGASLDIRGGDAWTRHLLGLERFRAGDWAAAATRLADAAEIDAAWSLNPLNLILLARAYFELGKLEEARHCAARIGDRLGTIRISSAKSFQAPRDPDWTWDDWLYLQVALCELEPIPSLDAR